MAVSDRHFPTFVLDNPLRRLFFPPQKKVSNYLAPGQIAADIGSGPGFYTITMAKIVGDNGRVFAADTDPDAIEKLKMKASGLHLDHIIQVKVASAARLNFIEESSVDFALSNGVICCMSDHEGAFRELLRVLKVGAKSYVSVTKFIRQGDSRGVSESEWERLLSSSGINILQRGRSMTELWAVVVKA